MNRLFDVLIGLVIIAVTVSGVACFTPLKPAAYGAKLAYCLETSPGKAEYEKCCTEVAMEYKRDPGFCKLDSNASADAGVDVDAGKDASK